MKLIAYLLVGNLIFSLVFRDFTEKCGAVPRTEPEWIFTIIIAWPGLLLASFLVDEKYLMNDEISCKERTPT